MIAETDQEAIAFAFQTLRDIDPAGLRIIRIRNTLYLEELLVSPAVLPRFGAGPTWRFSDPRADGSTTRAR